MVFAVDFDGTVAFTDYPRIIAPNQPVVDFIRRAKEKGHKIIIWTCRKDEELLNAIIWLEENNIPFDKVNESLDSWIEHYGWSRKIGADYYIDDKAVNVSHIDALFELL